MNKYSIDEQFDTHLTSTFDNLAYSKQLSIKQSNLTALFKKIDIKPNVIIENPKPKGYRHKVILSATNVKVGNKMSLKLGLFVEGTKTIHPFINHLIHDEDINAVFSQVEAVLNKNKILAHQDPKRGILKHVLIRKSSAYHEMMIVFVTKASLFPNHKEIVKDIVNSCPNVKTIIQNIQKRNTPIVLGDKDRILYGKGYIHDEIDGLRFRLNYASFYQVNPYQMKNLYAYAITKAGMSKTDYVVDCYSGIGTISLLASQYAKKVTGIEVNQKAVEDANYNKGLNSVLNAEFICEDVEKMLPSLKGVDILIMNPTRQGATEKFLESVKALNPKKIIYISCDPHTLLRDLRILKSHYNIKEIQPFDMFSYTQHVENVALLSLVKD